MRAYRVAYDGRPYRGFQRQPDVPTVEDALFDALAALDVAAGTPPGYAAAGRTDAGVSAVAQTIAFDAPEWLSPAAFNGELPHDVRVWASAAVPGDFHATADATARKYAYHLHAPTLERERVEVVLAALAGEHDFHNLTPDDEGTVRTLETDVERDGEFLVLHLRAGGFARHMVRRIASLVVAVAAGDRPMGYVGRILSPEPVEGADGVATAPAEPLVLRDVAYEVAFDRDPTAAGSARSVFEDRRIDRATRTRVAADLRDGVG